MKYVIIEKYLSKKCSKCKIVKPLTREFYPINKKAKNRFASCCKHCKQLYYKQNKDTILYKKKQYYQNNKISKQIKQRDYNKMYKHKKQLSGKLYRLKNKYIIQQKKNEYDIKKRQIDFLYKLKGNIRSLIKQSIKNNGYSKTTKTFEILGCSFEEFKKHIERQFEPWMTWDNYGKYNGEFNFGWDLDHIIPISQAKTEEEIIKLNHYTNFQPLCSKFNRTIKINTML